MPKVRNMYFNKDLVEKQCHCLAWVVGVDAFKAHVKRCAIGKQNRKQSEAKSEAADRCERLHGNIAECDCVV